MKVAVKMIIPIPFLEQNIFPEILIWDLGKRNCMECYQNESVGTPNRY